MYFFYLLLQLLTTSTALAYPSAPLNDRLIKTVYQFPNETWVENLAIRPNGKILATLIGSPDLWQIDPKSKDAQLITSFPNATSTLGIAEVREDFFAVAVGNWSYVTFSTTPGSYSIWTIDLSAATTSQPCGRVVKITDVPQAGFLNGLCSVPGQPDTVLVGDSDKGVIYQINLARRSSSIWLDDPAFKPNTTVAAQLGINGIHSHGGYLYFVNSFLRPTIGRVPINKHGKPAGPVERVIDQSPWPSNTGDHGDDFAFDKDGNMWVTADPSNLLVKVNVAKRTSVIVAGGLNDRNIAGDTAAAFGRTNEDENVLYITTNGGIAYPRKTGVEGGKIAALDISRLR
ncbi:hypothetical protein PRZ48_007318 [Zasmidium cellare]|uniref:SMP-30/Gluconolactonase/LRE-like region domain-containing protein n=1 Tax=Zasmidium cellare TaxID=395010 RepID=A0ABR0EJE9_ZASCE|nr:hypothetical protein PRZ48_007318 [Zasmidium cellare]